MNELVDLSLKGIIVFLIAVSEREYCDACDEVKVFFSIKVIQMYALALVKDDLETVLCMEEVLLGLIDIFFHCDISHLRHLLLRADRRLQR